MNYLRAVWALYAYFRHAEYPLGRWEALRAAMSTVARQS